MSIKCANCGRELPDGASFCPYCETSLVARTEVPRRRPWRKKAAVAALVCVIAAAAAFAVYKHNAPKTYEGGAQLEYTDSDGAYELYLGFEFSSDKPREAMPEAEDVIPGGVKYSKPSQLAITLRDGGADAQAAFLKKVESCSVETIPENGAQAMEHTDPQYDENFPNAAMVSHIRYSSECGTNEVRWTLKMKNGDTIILRQTIRVSLMPSINVYPEDSPMETIGELTALMQKLEKETDANTVINLYLPPVTYEGGLSISGRAFNIYGSSDGKNTTAFTGTVRVETEAPDLVCISGVDFRGNGGVGLSATASANLSNCSFSGFDTAAASMNGAWLMVSGCTFEDNTVALEFDTNTAHYSNPVYSSDTFTRNGTAILLTNLPGDETLIFPDCVFTSNGTNINNLCGHPTDISEAAVS